MRKLQQPPFNFERKIESRVRAIDGTQEVTLACGHSLVMIIPLPDSQQLLACAQCVNDWIE